VAYKRTMKGLSTMERIFFSFRAECCMFI